MELCSMLCSSLVGRGVWGRMDTCICMAEFLLCSPETITILTAMTQYKIKSKKLKKKYNVYSIHILILPWPGIEPTFPAGQADSFCWATRVGKTPWRKKWQHTPIFLTGKSDGQNRLVGYSPWGLKRVGHDLETRQQQQINYILIKKERERT